MHTIRIAGNNLFWLQGSPFLPEAPGAPQPGILEGLADLWQDLAPDILCLQEVQSHQAFDAVRNATGMSGAWCPGAELPQYGGAILWRSGRLLADSRSADPAPQRVWQIAAVPRPAGGELRVANCHLPSNRQLGAEAAAARRAEELSGLLTTGRRPEVVLGDFNEQPGGPLADFLIGKGYVDAAALAGGGGQSTTVGGGRGDQIWVAEEFADRIRGYGVISEERMRAGVPGREHLSDHFPLWVDLEI